MCNDCEALERLIRTRRKDVEKALDSSVDTLEPLEYCDCKCNECAGCTGYEDCEAEEDSDEWTSCHLRSHEEESTMKWRCWHCDEPICACVHECTGCDHCTEPIDTIIDGYDGVGQCCRHTKSQCGCNSSFCKSPLAQCEHDGHCYETVTRCKHCGNKYAHVCPPPPNPPTPLELRFRPDWTVQYWNPSWYVAPNTTTGRTTCQ